MTTWLDALAEKGEGGLADARSALSLLDAPLTEAKRALARKRLQRGVEALAIVWRELGEIPAEQPFTPPPPDPEPKGAVVPNVVFIQQRRGAR